MTRRDWLKLAALVSACAAGLRSSTDGYGRVDVARCINEGWHPATVYLDGVEVKKCVEFDDREGWVEYQVLNADGQAQLNASRNGVFTERRNGSIRFVPNTSYES